MASVLPSTRIRPPAAGGAASPQGAALSHGSDARAARAPPPHRFPQSPSEPLLSVHSWAGVTASRGHPCSPADRHADRLWGAHFKESPCSLHGVWIVHSPPSLGGDSRGQRTEEEPGCPTQLGSLTILFSASRGRYPLCSTSSAPNCFLESACFNPHLEICQCGVFGKEGAKGLYEKARLGLPWVRQRLCRMCNIYLSS